MIFLKSKLSQIGRSKAAEQCNLRFPRSMNKAVNAFCHKIVNSSFGSQTVICLFCTADFES